MDELYSAHIKLYKRFSCLFCGINNWKEFQEGREIRIMAESSQGVRICKDCIEQCAQLINPDGIIYLQSKLSSLSLPNFLGLQGEGMRVGEFLAIYDRRSREEFEKREKLKGHYFHEERVAENLREHGPSREDTMTSTSADYNHNRERQYIVNELDLVQGWIHDLGGCAKYDHNGEPVKH
jgi:hypothetical protein